MKPFNLAKGTIRAIIIVWLLTLFSYYVVKNSGPEVFEVVKTLVTAAVFFYIGNRAADIDNLLPADRDRLPPIKS